MDRPATTRSSRGDEPDDDASTSEFVRWAAAARGAVGDRDDLRGRIDTAAARATRAATVVAVVGEFKQGKSALINSLLSESVCPIDDHVATSVVTVVSHGAEPAVIVRGRRRDGEQVALRADPSQRRELLTEAGDPSAEVADGLERSAVERIDIRVPNPLLETGLVLVDTPGVGGLRAAHARATRAFLPSADALVFVSDATSELTSTELDFLRDAAEICPDVVLALTKIDLFPDWRRVRDLDAEHLARAGIEAPLLPLSYPLRVEAARRGDRALDDESGYPALASHLQHEVVPAVRGSAEQRAVDEIGGVLRSLEQAARDELAVLDDPAGADDALAELTEARERLDGMAAGSARWRTVLQDEMTELSQDVQFRFRDGVRSALDEMDAAVDGADGQDDLDAAAETMRSTIVEAVGRSFEEIEAGIDTIAERVANVLGLDDIDVGSPAEIAEAAREASGVWSDRDASDDEGSVGQDAFAVVRGAQGGILMIAVMGGLLPAAAASVVVAAPFMIGAGVLFGGKSILDLRDQKRRRARQQLKTGLRKAADEVQFRVGAELGEALRQAQRHLRDELSARIDELHRTTAETVERLEAVRTSDEQRRAARRQEVAARATRLAELLAAAPGEGQEVAR